MFGLLGLIATQNRLVKLVQNYRSHPAILEFPSKTWYDGELVPRVPDDVASRFLAWSELRGREFPLLFYSVPGESI